MKYAILASLILHALSRGNPFVIDTLNGNLPIYIALFPVIFSIFLILISLLYIKTENIVLNLTIIILITPLLLISTPILLSKLESKQVISLSYFSILFVFFLCIIEIFLDRKRKKDKKITVFD